MSQKTRQTPHSKIPDQLEGLWNDLLSCHPGRIRRAFHSLDPSNQKSVLSHLQHMASDAGWQPEQRLSAQAAIRALAGHSNQVET